jgi:hypothetical protein
MVLAMGSMPLFGQLSLSEVRLLPPGSVVTTTGTISSGDEFGFVRYMQDAEAGIAMYSDDLSSTSPGDSIIVTGVLSTYRGEVQVSPVFSFQVVSKGRPVGIRTIENFKDHSFSQFESRKVVLPCAAINSCESELASGWYELYDQWGNIIRLWVADDHPVEGFPLFDRPVTVEGIWTKFEDQYQLSLQQVSDASEGNCHYIPPAHLAFSQGLPSITWDQVPSGITEVRFGADSLDTSVSIGLWSGDLTFSPDFLLPGKIYKARLTQADVLGNTYHSPEVLFAVPNMDAPAIDIIFNRSVNAAYSDGSAPLATGSSAIETDLVKRIDEVRSTLDIAMYNTGRASIVQAVTRAVQRGVVVRYIADDETSNGALDGQLSFPVLFRSGDGIMHNKFVIGDVADSTRAWLWTGSTNLSTNQLSSDPNHAYVIRDQALAANYLREFEEMWGMLADRSDARHGDYKTNNTAHLFQVGEAVIESWFSPSDETNCRIIESLQSADHQALIGLLLLTREDIVQEIIRLHQAGIDTRVILEDEETSTFALALLKQAGVPVVTHDPSPIFHHKYAIIDEGYPDSDPQVITGSHNWTWSADNINDENTLIIHDQTVTNIFRQEYEARWGELSPTSLDRTEVPGLNVYPNPASTIIHIENPRVSPCGVELINVHGQIVDQFPLAGNEQKQLALNGDIPSGVYVVRFRWLDQQVASRVVVIE